MGCPFGHGTARKSLTYLIEPVASSTEITFQMTGRDKLLIRRLFNGHYYQLRGDTKVISVEANAIVCSIGNVDITSHSCKLTFGGKTINLTGDAAYQLYATMSQAGVPSEGSAGEVHESLSHLVCTINPLEIAKRNGAGADCTFDAAAK